MIKYIGTNLREKRMARHLTIAELSLKTGISRNTIINLENGTTALSDEVNQTFIDFFRMSFHNRGIEPVTRIKPFVPFITEDEMIAAKPLLDTTKYETVGDVKSDKENFLKLIYK